MDSDCGLGGASEAKEIDLNPTLWYSPMALTDTDMRTGMSICYPQNYFSFQYREGVVG
jgi:hypothetical protein